MKRIVPLFIWLSMLPMVYGQVINNSLGDKFTSIYPELKQGYIDLNRNSRKDESGDINEVIPDSRVKDEKIQVQEILDFLKMYYQYIPMAKLDQSYQALVNAQGPIGELIALSYTGTMADILDKKKAIGDQLFLTPAAYQEAIEKINGYIANMNKAYQEEGRSLEQTFLTSREELLKMVGEGYPYPTGLSNAEIKVLTNSMITLMNKPQNYSEDQIKSAMKLSAFLKAEDTVPYIEPLLSTPTYFDEGINTLGKIGGSQARQILTTQLQTIGKAREVIPVLEALGKVADEEDVNNIVNYIEPEDGSAPVPDYEKAALKSLADMSLRGISDNKIQSIFETYLKSNNPELRMGAIKGLGNQGTKAEELLLPLLRTEKDEQVIIETIKALSSSASRATTQTFLGLLRTDTLEPPVRREIIKSLASSDQGVQAVPYIANDLSSSEEIVQSAAVQAMLDLYPYNPQTVTATLTRGLLTNTNPIYRESASQILAQLADPNAVPTLIQMLDKPERQVKENATWALYKIGPDNNVRLLTNLKNLVTSEAEPLSVRVNAVRTIGKIGTDTPQLNLWQTLMTAAKMKGDKYYMLKFYAIEALGNLGDKREEIIDILTQIATRDRDEETQIVALESLGKLGIPIADTESSLISLYKKSDNPNVKLQIILTLSDMDASRVVEIAPEMLVKDIDLSARKKIIYSLSRMGTTQTLTLCLDAAKVEDIYDYVGQILSEANPTVMKPLIAQRLKGETNQEIIQLLEDLQAEIDASF
ncbi:HEAT repeat domain-containing protein [Spirochaeta cellobiosiphila]|uniref:HEAT repeat domain-containing protein n=1 Tax=Spirochaeta cellobiosiphila TaxID=504483 RepID=UPI00040B3A92|nr:HEAT repeat domain-containing protein [Spirochaeta cellobiosiphila]